MYRGRVLTAATQGTIPPCGLCYMPLPPSFSLSLYPVSSLFFSCHLNKGPNSPNNQKKACWCFSLRVVHHRFAPHVQTPSTSVMFWGIWEKTACGNNLCCDFPKVEVVPEGSLFWHVEEIQQEWQMLLDVCTERDFHGAFQAWQEDWDKWITAQEDHFKGDGGQIWISHGFCFFIGTVSEVFDHFLYVDIKKDQAWKEIRELLRVTSKLSC